MDRLHGGNGELRPLCHRRWGVLAAVKLCAVLLVALDSANLPAQQALPWSRADLAAGRRQEKEGQEACVDFYYRATIHAWTALEQASPPVAANPDFHAAYEVYQQSLAQLIPAASRFGRLDPRSHLIVSNRLGRRAVPITYYGFAWRPSDFCRVIPASEFQGGELKRHFRSPGLGIGLVAVRRACFEEPFLPPTVPFAVTAILRPAQETHGSPEASSHTSVGGGGAPEARLEFYNPHLFGSLPLGSASVPIERDISAPFVYLARESPRQYLRGFFIPDEVEPKLLMLEPHQRGKLPVIFVHGLLSDPTTWLDAVNELRAQPDLYQQCQFWYFRYPTGGALLESAAVLREQLVMARERFDPACQDAAMGDMVLVGHSMGGLMARLQVTYSHGILWRHAARQPLEAVRAAPAMRDRLERDFFFDPSPSVGRVVFIGTPHRGAGMARRLTGQLASSLVRTAGSQELQYRQMVDQNRDVFYEYLWGSPPTSIDLLEPANPLLRALSQMPFRPGMPLHSIIGTGRTSLLGEPGDGVVPVSSARLDGVCSELFVPVHHTELHRDGTTVAELSRILREHAQPLRNRLGRYQLLSARDVR